jgi:hypothetical protein
VNPVQASDGALHTSGGGAQVLAPAVLGVLMLDTRFPRVVGDVGNPATFNFTVRHVVVQGASPQRVVRQHDASLLAPFIAAGRQLVAEGATAITTSCGFLVQFQQELQAALPVPVWTSSLLLLPSLRAPGVVTVDADSLTPAHLCAAGASEGTPVEGLESGCAFQRTLLDNLPTLDTEDAAAQVVVAARRLVARHPDIEHIVLECTNMPPYAQAVQAATGRTVHDITTLVRQRLAEAT